MLKAYADKRHFDVTTEPGPEVKDSGEGPLTFVVQKHAATHLHYDFRLELNGVLLSWAVPKGPSLNPQERRLAARTEDHPLDYGGFEGSIPQGQYGGGQVIIWDRGTYEAQKVKGERAVQVKKLNEELEAGKLEFILHGEKLKGAWVLIHTRGKQWLLMKRTDEFASERDILSDDQSVVSGRRIGGVPDVEHAGKAPSQPSKRLPICEPMLLTEAPKPFASDEWSFELKLDGVRVVTSIEGDTIQMVTRNGHIVTDRFPFIVNQLRALKLESAILDGEVVQFDANGLPNFQAVIQPFQAGRVTTGDYCLFDVMALRGEDLTKKSFKERREILDGIKLDQPNLKRLDTFPRDGVLLFEQAIQMGFEGIVGKKLSSRYQCGVRSKDWVKLKGYLSEEFVVAGFTTGDSARAKTFGALLLGQQTPEGLVYVGNVGGGFSDNDLDTYSAMLRKIESKEMPLVAKPPIKHVTWVEPKIVVEVRFTGWTNDKKLRFPIFMRMRPDVEAVAASPAVAEQAPKETMIDPVLKALDELSQSGNDAQLELNGHRIKFSSLTKELWPGVTKADLARFYATASGSILPYLKDRPLSFVRCPDGVGGERFFQKHWDKGRPEFVETVSIHSDHNSGARDFVMCNNLETLLWLAQMAAVELNPWNSRITADKDSTPEELDFWTNKESLEQSVLNRVDYLVLDLDPHFGGKATGWRKPEWERLVEVAICLRDILKQIDVKCFPKSSGKSGLHVYVPVARDYTYDQIRAAAGILGEQAKQVLGARVTLEWNVKKRPDGVFIDVNQNVRGKTMAAAYSPRASTHPGVSMPLLWSELERVDPTTFTVLTAAARLSEKGDLWAETLGLNQRLFS